MTTVNFKLVALLNSFTANEIKEFKKFLSSGLYTSGRNYTPLLNYLIKYKSKGLDNLFARNVYSRLYPGKKFSSQTLKNRFSELYKLGEEFLIYLGLKKDKFEKDKLLLKMLIEKNLLSPFESKYKKIIDNVESEKYDDRKYEIILSLHNINMEFLYMKRKENAIYDHYHENAQLKLCLYLISLFEIGFEYEVQEYINKNYENNYVNEFLTKLNISELMDSFSKSHVFIYKVTAMNYYLYKAYEYAGKEEFYFKSHKMFTELSKDLKEDYRILKFNQMIQYSIKKQNEGIKKFQIELFNLYNEKLSQGLFSDLQTGIYLLNNFRDYVYIGIAIKKYSWVEDFLKKYSKELPEEFREDEVNLSYAKLHIAHNNFEKSLLSLDNIKTANYLLYLDSSILKLICYYELGLFEDSYLELDKLKHYLRNHKEIPKFHTKVNTEFVKMYQKLLRIVSNPQKEKDPGYLESEIKSLGSVTKKDWILEKIFELKN